MSFEEIEKKIFTETIPLMEKVKFDSSNWWDLAPVLLSCAILESIDSVCLLGRSGKKLQAEIILRSALEQYVALLLVCKSSFWIDGMLLREQLDWRKTFERSKAGNKYFAGFGEKFDIDELISQHDVEIARLKSAGAKWGKPRDRFSAAGHLDAYEGLYHKLSDSVHSNLISLKGRYLDVQTGALVVSLDFSRTQESLDAVEGSARELLDHLESVIRSRFLAGDWKFDQVET